MFVAKGLWRKIGGLLIRPPLAEGEALLIYTFPAHIHMFFMKYPIDAIFLDKGNRVVGLEQLKPWQTSKIYWKADKVLELPWGTIERSKTQIADQINISS